MDDAIVLQDSRGEKVYTSIFGRALAFYGLGRQQFVVVRGELLVPIPGDEITPRKDGQKPHNYQLKRDPTVLLYCKDDGEDIAPLDKYESLLLEAIKNPTTRYEVFSASNILNWGSRLKPGNMVYVVIPGQHTAPVQYAAAVIRYVGGLKTELGIQFGVEITVRLSVALNWLQHKHKSYLLPIRKNLLTFSQNIGQVFSKLKLVTDNLSLQW